MLRKPSIVLLATLAAAGCNWVLAMDDVDRAPSSSAKAGSNTGAVSNAGAGGSEPTGVGGTSTAGTDAKGGGGTNGSASGAASTGARPGAGDGGGTTGQGGRQSGGGATAQGGEPSGEAGVDAGPDCHDAGSAYEAALDLAEPPSTVLGCYVSANDDDWFLFTIPEIGTLTYSLEVRSDNATAYLFPYTKGVLDQNPSAALDRLDSGATHSIKLAAGRYYLHTTTSGGGVIYDLDVTHTPYAPTGTEPEPDPPPGDSAPDACSLGDLEANRVLKYRGFVGDTDDFYRFGLAKNGVLTYSLDNVKGSVTGRVYKDVSPLDLMNGDLNNSQPVTQTFTSSGITLESGSYLFRVTPNARSLYTLVLSINYQ